MHCVVPLQTASGERTAAVAALQALQMCDAKAKCSLHVGLTQVPAKPSLCELIHLIVTVLEMVIVTAVITVTVFVLSCWCLSSLYVRH